MIEKKENELNSIFENEDINTLFQRIININNNETLGYEALSRGPENSILNMPKELFTTADKYDRNYELEILCLKKALSNFSFKEEKLFVNINSETIEDPVFKTLGLILLEHVLDESNIKINNVVLEIKEIASINNYADFEKNIAFLKNKGYGLAVEVNANSYSDLKKFLHLKPNYIKLGIGLVKNVDSDSLHQEMIYALKFIAEINKISIIAEGIENEKEYEYLKSIGMNYGQGYYIQLPEN